MENPVISPCPGSGAFTLTQAEGKSHHEFFPMGATREVLLLGDLEEQDVHHIPKRKKKPCFMSSVGRCPHCDAVPFDSDVEAAQTEYIAPAYVRSIRDAEFVQRVVTFPCKAGEQVKAVCGELQRGRLFRIVRGTSNRLSITLLTGLPVGLPAALPPAFPVMPFVRAFFGLKPDPRVPVMKLPPIRCETPRAATVRSQRLRFTADDAAGFDDEARHLLKSKLAEWHQTDAAAPPAATPPAAVVEPAEVTTPIPPAPAPAVKPAAGPLLSEATPEQIRVEGIKRRLSLHGDKPPPPPEMTDTVADLVTAAANGGTEPLIPKIKRHPDGTWTGPATVPIRSHGTGCLNGTAPTNGKPKGGR